MHCDRCGSLAKSRFTKGKHDLLFCGHHTQEFRLALTSDGFQKDFQFTVEQDSQIEKVGV